MQVCGFWTSSREWDASNPVSARRADQDGSVSVIHPVCLGLKRYFRIVDAPGVVGVLVVSVVGRSVG